MKRTLLVPHYIGIAAIAACVTACGGDGGVDTDRTPSHHSAE